MSFCRIHRRIKRHFLLLEVLIALALVALCSLPLLYPHFWMISKEQEALKEIEADRLANLVYVQIVEQLYMNDFSWETLQNGQQMEIPHPVYRITYTFQEIPPSRGDPGKGHTGHLFKLGLHLAPHGSTNKILSYEFMLFVERKIKLGT